MTPSEWSQYADKVGLGATAVDNPANERQVARQIALNFADQYNGSWADVATAWFAGPGKHVISLQAQIHNPYPPGSLQAANYEPPAPVSINQLADRVTSIMHGGVGTSASSSDLSGTDLGLTEDMEDPQTAALAMLKQEHPAEYGGTVMAARAKEFFDNVGQPTVGLAAKN